jgi:hypothetical protein
MTLEQELIQIFAVSPYQRNREILIGYYGWKDGQQHTLTEIGARFGVTRERVRQVCAKFTKRGATSGTTPAPVMERALTLIAQRLPCAASEVEADLTRQGLTTIGMSVESVAAGAKLLGRPADFKVIKIHDGKGPTRQAVEIPPTDRRLVIRPDEAEAVPATVDLAKKQVYFHGLGSVEQILRGIAAATGASVGEPLVRQTLMQINGFYWLDEARGWFHLRGIQKHGLPRAIEKVLAVAGEVTAAQLCAALGRNRRLWKEPPPEKVLLAYCRQMPQVRVEDDRISADPPVDWRRVLTGVEEKLVRVLADHGPVMERGAIEDLCVADGMNRFSFHAFISWSPVIAQYGHSLYGLLGTKASPEQVDTLLAERRAKRLNHRVLNRHGRTEDGKIWLSYRLSKAASTYAVITVPAALKKAVRGRFSLLAADGRAIGTLATKDGRAWGLGAFLREQDARIGDRIILTLDLENRTAVVSWEGKEVLIAEC